MNIDLLLTAQGEAGLVSDKALQGPLAGVMLDAESGQMTLEFADADSLELNIPLALDLTRSLRNAHAVHVGIIERGVIADSRQVPLVLQDDPFGGGNHGRFAGKPGNSVMAFERFMKNANAGQPVHRDDVGNEATTSSVMRGSGLSAATMQFAPGLTRQRALEAAPRAAPAPRGPQGPGGMGGGGNRSPIPPPRPPAGSPGEDQE